MEREARASTGQCGEGGIGGPLREEDGDPVFVGGEEEQSRRLTIDVGEVCALKSTVGGQGVGIGEVEAEWETALEPRFDGVAVA